MGGHEKKWAAGLGLALLALTGIGLAGAGPLAGILGGSGAGAAGAGGAAAGTGAAATGASTGTEAAALGAGAGAGAAGSAASTAGSVATAEGAKSLFAGMLKQGAITAGTNEAMSAMTPEQTITQPMGSQLQSQDPNSVFQIIQELKHRNYGT